MCYNCGCGREDDDMGKGHAGVDVDGKSITNETFKAAAQSQDMDEMTAKENTLKLLTESLKSDEKDESFEQDTAD